MLSFKLFSILADGGWGDWMSWTTLPKHAVEGAVCVVESVTILLLHHGELHAMVSIVNQAISAHLC